LACPWGAPHKTSAMWDPIREKIKCCLAGYKKLYLSKGGGGRGGGGGGGGAFDSTKEYFIKHAYILFVPFQLVLFRELNASNRI
jgi:hypothetical protein